MANKTNSTMNRMEVSNISANMRITFERVIEALNDCGIKPTEGTISLEETVRVMNYIKTQQADPAQRSRDALENLVSSRTLFIDTCELLAGKFPELVKNLKPLLKKYGKKLYIPSGVEQELKLLFFRDDMMEKVHPVLEQIEKLIEDGIVEIWGNGGESFADQQMFTIAAATLLSEDTAFITRDIALSEDLLTVNSLASVQGKNVAVYRINRYGFLSKYKTDYVWGETKYGNKATS